jgi:hypothetical protein
MHKIRGGKEKQVEGLRVGRRPKSSHGEDGMIESPTREPL